jgi:hypothetical protein
MDTTRLITIGAAVSGLAILLMVVGMVLTHLLSDDPANQPLAGPESAEESEPSAAETTDGLVESATSPNHASTGAGATDAGADPGGLDPNLSLVERIARHSRQAAGAEAEDTVDMRGSEPAPIDETSNEPSIATGAPNSMLGGIGQEQGMASDGVRSWNLNNGDSSETEDAVQAEFVGPIEQARASMANGDYDRAKSLLRSADGTGDDQIRASFLLGLLAALVDHDFEKAEEYFSQCVERSPESGSFLNNLAVTEVQNRDFLEAFRHWEKALISQDDGQPIAVIAHNIDILLQYIDRHPGAVPRTHQENFRSLRDRRRRLFGGTTNGDSGWLYMDVERDADGTFRSVQSRSIGALQLEDDRCHFCNVCRGCGRVKCPNTDCKQGFLQPGNQRVPCDTCHGRKSVPCPHCSDGIRG